MLCSQQEVCPHGVVWCVHALYKLEALAPTRRAVYICIQNTVLRCCLCLKQLYCLPTAVFLLGSSISRNKNSVPLYAYKQFHVFLHSPVTLFAPWSSEKDSLVGYNAAKHVQATWQDYTPSSKTEQYGYSNEYRSGAALKLDGAK